MDVQQAEFDSKKKNIILAYLLWFFLPGIHRIYLNRIGTGILFILSAIIGFVTLVFIVGIGILIVLGIWWLIDAFFIHKWVENINLTLLEDMKKTQ